MLLNRRLSFLFSLPAVVLYAIFVLIPIVYGFYLSLTSWNGLSPTLTFIGFENYMGLFKDPRFWNSMKVTFIFTIVFAVVQNVIALLLALLLDLPMKRWANSFIRVLIFLPTILTPIIVGYLWYYILKSGLPAVFDFLGMEQLAQIQWIGSMKWSLYSEILVSVWLHLGVTMLIYVNSINSIPEEVHQAAMLDGAVKLKKVYFIYLPLIMPALLINTILSIITGFKQFDQVFVMTNGGPGTATETASLLIYKLAFISDHVGEASAVAYILFLIVMLISLLIIRTFRTKEVEA